MVTMKRGCCPKLGVRADGTAYAQAQIKITPDVPSVRSKLLMRLGIAGSKIPIGNGLINANTASMNARPVSGIFDYVIVAGLDLDGDGELRTVEVVGGGARPGPDAALNIKYFSSAGSKVPTFKIIGGVDYAEDIAFFEIGQFFVGPVTPTAAGFLDAFLDDNTPGSITDIATPTSSICRLSTSCVSCKSPVPAVLLPVPIRVTVAVIEPLIHEPPNARNKSSGVSNMNPEKSILSISSSMNPVANLSTVKLCDAIPALAGSSKKNPFTSRNNLLSWSTFTTHSLKPECLSISWDRVLPAAHW